MKDDFIAIILDHIMGGLSESFIEKLSGVYFVGVTFNRQEGESTSRTVGLFYDDMSKELFVTKVVNIIAAQDTERFLKNIIKKDKWEAALFELINSTLPKFIKNKLSCDPTVDIEEGSAGPVIPIISDKQRLRWVYTGASDSNRYLQTLIDSLNYNFKK